MNFLAKEFVIVLLVFVVVYVATGAQDPSNLSYSIAMIIGLALNALCLLWLVKLKTWKEHPFLVANCVVGITGFLVLLLWPELGHRKVYI